MMGRSRQALEQAAILVATVAITALVAWDGALPSIYTNLYLLPIVVAAWRHSLAWAATVAVLAGLGSSPALSPLGVHIHDSLRPVLWLGWPAIYLFFAVGFSQWQDLRRQRQELQKTEQILQVSQIQNRQRQEELLTLSAVHDAIISEETEAQVCDEIARQVAALTQAKICSIVVPINKGGEAPAVIHGMTKADFERLFPEGAPYGEGVAGWAMLHRRVAWSPNVHRDARYDQLRAFARQAGYTAAAAAPIQFDGELFGALAIGYEEEREFAPEELARLERLARQAALAIRSARQRETLSRFAYETAIALTEAIESRDPYTGGHCHRLSAWAVAVAQRLGLPDPDVESIRLGAILHDVGKIVVPDVVLMKPGKLTPVEFAAVKQHCYSGGQICKRVPFLRDAYPIVYHHHERYDGSGYPDGLEGEEIPLGARIVAVADAYDAMTTDRPYRQALPGPEAQAILERGAGKQWDPHVVDVVLELISSEGGPLLSEASLSYSHRHRQA